MLARMRSMFSGVFFSGQVLLPSLSTMFTTSQWSARAPALATQVSLAMMLPQNTIRVSSLTERVGKSAFSHQSHFLSSTAGFLQSSSVSKSSTSSTSGRTASFLDPRGALPAPTPMNDAPPLVTKCRDVHWPGFICSP